MTPTSKFRFVKRVFAVPATDGEGRTVRVLQQWWEPTCQYGCEEVIDYKLPTERYIKNVEGAGEWRDVPVEKEE
jgi:hypothetical protein